MMLAWADDAWNDYLYWQQTDKRMLKRINMLLKGIQRQPFAGLGDPEPLKHNWSGFGRAASTKSTGWFTA